jgi:hypothetical protein
LSKFSLENSKREETGKLEKRDQIIMKKDRFREVMTDAISEKDLSLDVNSVRFKNVCAGWNMEDLKKAIVVDKENYEPWAINIIKEEIQSRNVNIEDLGNLHKNHIREEESLREVNAGLIHMNLFKQIKSNWYLVFLGGGLALLHSGYEHYIRYMSGLHPEEKNILIIDIFIGISLVVISIILFRKKKKK